MMGSGLLLNKVDQGWVGKGWRRGSSAHVRMAWTGAVAALTLIAVCSLSACGEESGPGAESDGTGGGMNTGGMNTTATGGIGSGGLSTAGGAVMTGGIGSGGMPTTGGDVMTGGIGSGGASTGGDVSTGGAGCANGLSGPNLVRVPAPAGAAASAYCIDATEVTNAQYALFVAAGVATDTQIEACAWNDSYEPREGWPATDKENYPVVYVDWCDAYAYCTWAGKHLCGHIGGGESHHSFDRNDPERNEWYNACSAGGSKIYPYGDAYEALTCVSYDYSEPGYQPYTETTQPVGTTTCEGGFPGLYDMSGNVMEWANACENRSDPTDSECNLRGGAASSGDVSLECGQFSSRPRDFTNPWVGFRCCADAATD